MNRGIGASILAVLLAGAAQTAPAATITVNTTADNLTGGDGQCTLREAIANVNAAVDTTGGDCAGGTGTGDTVTFDIPLPATISVSLGELVIERDVNIVGPTVGSLMVNAHGSRIFRITTGATAGISDLSMKGGSPRDQDGGAIMNTGTLTASRCIFIRNKALHGGAIQNGIWGGADGTVHLSDCTLKANRARLDGGAIANFGTMTLTNCTLTSNSASSRDGGGGGVTNWGTMTLANCTLGKNRAPQGGAIFNSDVSTMSLTNCTLAGNVGKGGGGAIRNSGALTLTNCTISRNKAIPAGLRSLGGGGIWHNSVTPQSSVTLANTIVADNGRAEDCSGNLVTSGGHNLDSDGTCFTAGGTDLVGTDPLLVPLGDYGGPIPTLALCVGAGLPRSSCLAASPALDAGDDAVTGPPLNLTTDQRGLPRLSGSHVDIGAYEAQP